MPLFLPALRIRFFPPERLSGATSFTVENPYCDATTLTVEVLIQIRLYVYHLVLIHSLVINGKEKAEIGKETSSLKSKG